MFSGCGNVFISGLQVANAVLNASELVYMDDMFSNAPNIYFNPSVYNNYVNYLSGINNPRFTKIFQQSIPIPGATIDYQLSKYMASPALVYRVTGGNFQNVSVYGNGVAILAQAVPLKQALFALDNSQLQGINVPVYADNFMATFNVSTLVFAANTISQSTGAGYVISDLQATSAFLDLNTFINNQGASFYLGSALNTATIQVTQTTAVQHNSNSTFIDIQTENNQGVITIDGFYYGQSTVMSDPAGARKLNLISVVTSKNVPYNSSFSNCVVNNLTIINSAMIKS